MEYNNQENEYSLNIPNVKRGDLIKYYFTYFKGDTEYTTVNFKYTVAINTKITLDKKILYLRPGETEKVSANIETEEPIKTNIVWESDDSQVASVDNSGNVTAISEGSTIIRAETEDGKLCETCVANILGPISDEEEVNISSDDDDNVILKWKPAKNAFSYTISRKLEDGEFCEIANDIKDTNYVDKDILEEGSYVYKLNVVNGKGESTASYQVETYYKPKDADSDGLSDKEEIIIGTNPNKYDTDGDGISDYLEIKELKTNPLKIDSDEDGLPDIYEYSNLETNPTKKDTNENGIFDAEEDFDNDGLTNLQEYKLGTNPKEKDSDKDGISDKDEVEIYNTNPLKADTDGDGLNDGDEIAISFDPNNVDTDGNGIIDSKEKTTQSIKMSNWNSLGKNNIFDPSLVIYGLGNLNSCTVVKDIYNDNVFKNIRAVVGHPIEIKTKSNFDWAEIGFKLNDPSILGSRVDKGNQDPYNIKSLDDLTIAWYKEDTNQLIPIKTTVDKENYTLKAKVTHFSKYLVINKNILNYDWDVSNTSSQIDSGKADVVFAIDSTGSMGSSIYNVKKYIVNFVDNLQDKKVDARLGLIDYQDITHDGPNSTRNWGWYLNPSDFKDTLSKIYPDDGGDTPESSVDALEEARRMGFRNNANKFIILITDAPYKEQTRFSEIKSMDDEVIKLKEDNIITSVITYNSSVYKSVYQSTNGIYAYIYDDFTKSLNQLIDNIKNNVTDGVWIRLSNGTIVKLNKEPDKSDKVTDTDEDGVPDSEELIDKINVEVDPDSGKTIETWSFKSNPTIKDTDNDRLDDKIETLSGTDPCIIDTDQDELTDYQEVIGVKREDGEIVKTDPTKYDTDGDGIDDKTELEDETLDPLEPDYIYYAEDEYYDDGDDETSNVEDNGENNTASLLMYSNKSVNLMSTVSKSSTKTISGKINYVLKTNTKWSGRIHVYCPVYISKGITLDIAKNTKIFAHDQKMKIFHGGYEFIVKGKLNAENATFYGFAYDDIHRTNCINVSSGGNATINNSSFKNYYTTIMACGKNTVLNLNKSEISNFNYGVLTRYECLDLISGYLNSLASGIPNVSINDCTFSGVKKQGLGVCAEVPNTLISNTNFNNSNVGVYYHYIINKDKNAYLYVIKGNVIECRYGINVEGNGSKIAVVGVNFKDNNTAVFSERSGLPCVGTDCEFEGNGNDIKSNALKEKIISIGLDFIPGVNAFKAAFETLIGRDLITQEDLTNLDRGISIFGFVALPAIGKGFKALREYRGVLKYEKVYGKVAQTFIGEFGQDGIRLLEKHGDDIIDIYQKHGYEAVEFVLRKAKGNKQLGAEAIGFVNKFKTEGVKLADNYKGAYECINEFGEEAIELIGKRGKAGVKALQELSDALSDALKTIRKAGFSATDLIDLGVKSNLNKISFAKLLASGAEPRLIRSIIGRLKLPYSDFEKFGIETAKELDKFSMYTIDFDPNLIQHIFKGVVNASNELVGFHYEGFSDAIAKVLRTTVTKENKFGVYQAKVISPGKIKDEVSTFFPRKWSPEKVVEAINDAYHRRVNVKTNLYRAILSNGMEIEMYLDKYGMILTAYPKY